MKIFAIGDLHLDSKNEKPMNIFGDNWIDHEAKIFANWTKTVGQGDMVLIPGDISWAGRLCEAGEDLDKIDKLPGIKIIGKGNHDYWWSTAAKLDRLGLKTIRFLKNNSYEFDDVVICGTRGWDSYDNNQEGVSNAKIYKRELMRMKLSLDQCRNTKKYKIAMIHYPPFENSGAPDEFAIMMAECGVDMCIYGHLHGEEGHKLVREGTIGSIRYYCVASDYLDFKLKKLL